MLLFQHDYIPEETFFNFLSKRKGLLDWVSICWWEPTLQSDLYDFAKKIKQMGFLVKLDTNGRDVPIVEKLIQDRLLDYIAIDLKNTPEKYEKTIGVTQTKKFFDEYQRLFKLLAKSGVEYEYRTTLVKGLHTLADVEAMAKYIEGAQHYYLQNYIWGNTLDPNFWGQSFDDDELEEMKKVASQYVQHCDIRK